MTKIYNQPARIRSVGINAASVPVDQYSDANKEPFITQIDDCLFSISEIHNTNQFISLINWMNESSLEYKLTTIYDYQGVIVKFNNTEDAVLFKLSCVDSIIA